MRCPHCGSSGCYVSYRDWGIRHNCYLDNCCRETWKANCGHEWTQWTCG